MIGLGELEYCYRELYTYDVTQGAWELEGNGFEANARHVLTHLAKDLVAKDFSDPEVLRTTIAPDCIQYALRLSRWVRIDIAELIVDSPVPTTTIGSLPEANSAYVGAVAAIANNLHDLGHRSSSDEAMDAREEAMRTAGRHLIRCADLTADELHFNIVTSFDERLASLRQRFGIQDPAI